MSHQQPFCYRRISSDQHCTIAYTPLHFKMSNPCVKMNFAFCSLTTSLFIPRWFLWWFQHFSCFGAWIIEAIMGSWMEGESRGKPGNPRGIPHFLASHYQHLLPIWQQAGSKFDESGGRGWWYDLISRLLASIDLLLGIDARGRREKCV